MSGPNEPDWDFLYAVARTQLDTQLAFIDAIDTKLGIVFAAGSAEAAIVTGAFAITGVTSPLAVVVLALSLAAYIAIAWFSLRGLWPQGWAFGATITGAAADYAQNPHHEVIRRAVNAARLAYDTNRPRYDEKVCVLWLSLLSLAAETFAAAAALLLVAYLRHPGA